MRRDAENVTAGAPRVRFAPSPTGHLHLGGARTALFNWLFARRRGGVCVLRIEDTDAERSSADVLERLLDALDWLGLDWDEGPRVGGEFGPYLQSERLDLYREFGERLLREGRAFHCYMQPEELEARRREAIAAGRPFRYEGWHRELTGARIADFERSGVMPCVRLRVDPPESGYVVEDLIKGRTEFPPEQIDDFVLLRSDGSPSYHMANVIDDRLMRITHVIRGEDHLTNAIKHQALFAALGWAHPQYAHLPMILGPDRSKLSKRHGAVSVLDYRERGYLPEALVNELALLGWSAADHKECMTREELIERFDLDRVGKSGSIFDFDKLLHFNGLLIRRMPVEELARRLEPYMKDAPPIPEGKLHDLIQLIQEELHRLTDFGDSARRVLDEPRPTAEALADPAMAKAPAVLEKAAQVFAAFEGAWTRESVKAAFKEIGKAAGAKGKELFIPLRVALTGVMHGPALDGVALFLGRHVLLQRLASHTRLKVGQHEGE
jgi:glutamyl-tRNA synthetase